MQTCNISRKCTSRARSIVQKTYLEHTLRPYMVASLRVVRHHIRRSPPDFDRPCRYSHAAFVFVLCHMSQSNHSISSSHPRCILEPILKYCIFSFPHQSSRSEKLKDAMKKKLFPKDAFSFEKDANTEIPRIFEKFQWWLKKSKSNHTIYVIRCMVEIRYCLQGTPNSPEVHRYRSENECVHRYMAHNTLPIHSIVSSILLI